MLPLLSRQLKEDGQVGLVILLPSFRPQTRLSWLVAPSLPQNEAEGSAENKPFPR